MRIGVERTSNTTWLWIFKSSIMLHFIDLSSWPDRKFKGSTWNGNDGKSTIGHSATFRRTCMVSSTVVRTSYVRRGAMCFLWVGTSVSVAFAILRKATVSFDMSVRLSVCMEQLECQWTDFHEIWYLNIFRKSVKKIQVSLKSDENNGYFTWGPIYICDHISLTSS
jgi:hypothetical protein